MLENTDPNALIVETARRFAQERLMPTAAAREKAGRIEPEIIRELGEMGFLGATNSADWGGSEIPYETYAQVIEEIAAGDGSVSTLVSVHNAPTCEILEKFGTPAQKERWLRPMASGEVVASFALTEAGAGSDAAGIRTRAERTNSGYTINGSK
ncbi:MAG TPA: acyl-CoA dehydrogenase family protein, partial [Acetobacteraceae bacterium]